MPNDKVKYYRNPARSNNDAVRHYVPEYQRLGIEPKERNHAAIPGNVLVARGGVTEEENPRLRKPGIRQPYAEPSNVTLANGSVPNVGNNMEHTWSGVDEVIIDDFSGEQLDPNHPMIDNNNFVDYEEKQKTFLTQEDLQSAIQENNVLSDLQDNDYILIVNGNIISIGPLENIQEEASSLLFGEHELCATQSVQLEDIVVLRKVKIKTGLFLE